MAMDSDTTPMISEDTRSQEDLQLSNHLDDINQDEMSTGSEGVTKGVCGRVINVLKFVTVEPLMLLYITGFTVQSSITTNLLLVKICQEQKFSEEVCGNLSVYPSAQTSVQSRTNTLNMYMDLITYIPGFFFVLFLGSWSDKHGRKLPMLLPICGNFVAALIYLGNAFWMQLPSQYMLLAAIPRAMTGGGSTLFMACFSYMADISRVRSRTMRIAFMDFGFVLGPLVGLLSSDILFYKTGYLGVYGVSALFYLLALVYGIIRIVDTRGRFSPYHQQTTELSYQPGNMCLDLFDTENIKDTFRTATKPRPNKGRTKIFLLMSVMCTLLFVYVGSIDLLYTKLKFGWDYNQYIQLKVAELLLSLTGTTIVLPLFSFHLNIDDSLLGMVGAVSSIGGAVIRGLATQPWMLFFSYVVSCLGGMPLITTRSIMSKCVPDVELGKVFSMLASWESIIPLLSSPLFTLVYNATITTFPGTVYFLGACFYTLAFMIYVWLFVNRKPLPAPGHIHEENIPETED